MDEITNGIKSVLNNGSQVNQNNTSYQQNNQPYGGQVNGQIPYIIVLVEDERKKVTHADKMNLFLMVMFLFLVIILAVRG